MEYVFISCSTDPYTQCLQIIVRSKLNDVGFIRIWASLYQYSHLFYFQKERNVELTLVSLPKPANNQVQSEEENILKLPPNKLSEKIMKCLIFIFVRMLRTSRATELEKSGPVSKCNSFSMSFRADTTSSNSMASILQKGLRQQDPYGIFDTEHSMPRDIGPYKNLVVFTSSNLDPKCLSNPSSILLLQRLR